MTETKCYHKNNKNKIINFSSAAHRTLSLDNRYVTKVFKFSRDIVHRCGSKKMMKYSIHYMTRVRMHYLSGDRDISTNLLTHFRRDSSVSISSLKPVDM